MVGDGGDTLVMRLHAFLVDVKAGKDCEWESNVPVSDDGYLA